MGTRERKGVPSITTIAETSSTLVRKTAEIGGDLGDVTRGAIEGAITAAKEIGLGLEDAASAAATGAVKAASEISSEAVKQVGSVACGTIQGVKVVVRAPFETDVATRK